MNCCIIAQVYLTNGPNIAIAVYYLLSNLLKIHRMPDTLGSMLHSSNLNFIGPSLHRPVLYSTPILLRGAFQSHHVALTSQWLECMANDNLCSDRELEYACILTRKASELGSGRCCGWPLFGVPSDHGAPHAAMLNEHERGDGAAKQDHPPPHRTASDAAAPCSPMCARPTRTVALH